MLVLALALLTAPSPLDDLTREEIVTAVTVVLADKQFGDDARYPIIMAKEPAKATIVDWRRSGLAPRREAFVAIYEPTKNRFSEAIVDLATKKIRHKRELPGVQPPILFDEYVLVADIVHTDPKWQESMRKRGITNLDDVYVDGWVPGLMSPAERSSGRRLMRALSYLKEKGVNYYSRPIEGVLVTVDVNERKVIEVLDTGVVPIVKAADELKPTREAPRPLNVSFPKGVSYKVHGQNIEWEGWSFRYSMQPSKGLVIYDARFAGRPIMYKGALSEMLVPYGDPSHQWSFRNAFDVGEYGLGRAAHSLAVGVDTPEGAHFFDGVFAKDDGKPLIIPHAVAVYERDAGLLWKHVDLLTQKGEGRRARELVITFTTTIGNYDYGVDWIFALDGTIQVEAYLTGIMLAQGTSLTENACTEDCKRLVAKQIIAPNHQHFFNFRLDMDVDGESNTPQEMNVSAIKDNNPDMNGFEAVMTSLKRESQAQRDLAPASARMWKITSSDHTNDLNHPTGYMLVPGESATAYLGAASLIRARARFIEHTAWFTKYKDDEQSPAGDYPNQSNGGDGLPKFVADDESLEHTDVVLWYTFGVTHIPRPEEWPVMNAHRAGFKLKPFNFFGRNAALALPTVKARQSTSALPRD